MATYYWILGGTSNTDHASNWSLTSGGAGGAGVPTAADDIIFDNNSGISQTIPILIPTGATLSCRNFTQMNSFSGQFRWGVNSTLYIGGSAEFGGNCLLTALGAGILEFNSTSSGNTIKWNMQSSPVAMYFNGSGGEWKLLDNYFQSQGIPQDITLIQGTLDLNGKNLETTKSFLIGSNTLARSLKIGTGVLTCGNFGFPGLVTNATVDGSLGTVEIAVSDAVDRQFLGGIGFVYKKVKVSGSGTGSLLMYVGCTINTLECTATKKTIKFQAFSQHYIDDLVLNGAAGSLVKLQSQTPGQSWTISKTSGVLKTDYAEITDSHATAGATFYAGSHSSDMGGNTGWSFTDPPPGEFYWVPGGNGNTNSATNWALSSGGTAGAGIPTLADNITIDGNSGTGIVNIPVSTLSCRDFTVTDAFTGTLKWGGGTLGNTAILAVYGSMYLGTGVTTTSTGSRFCNFVATTTGKTIRTNGKSIAAAVVFNGAGGGWSLLDDYSHEPGGANIQITQGVLNLNGFDVTTTGSFILTSNALVRGLTIGTGTIICGNFGFNGTNFTNAIVDGSQGTVIVDFPDTLGRSFRGGGFTYKKVWQTGAGLGVFSIFDNNTYIKTLKSDNPLKTIKFEGTKTFKIDALELNGSAGSPFSLQPVTGGQTWTISKSSGMLATDYVALTNSAAVGGASFYAGSHSSDVSGNSGWVFTDNPVPPRTRMKPVLIG